VTAPALRLVERNYVAYRRMWKVFATGFFEPLFWLLSVGVGVAVLVGDIDGLPYEVFVAPGLLASSAMNGAIFDSTFNVFFRLKFAKTYDAILATPLNPIDVAAGELVWSSIRGLVYASAFLVIMWALDLVRSPWAAVALPAALLIGVAFSGVGMAATTWMRSFTDFDWIQLALMPLFLLSTSFFPLEVYPRALQLLVQVSPLYHGVALVRGLTTGAVGAGLLVHVAVLVALGAAGLTVAARRFEGLLLK
jgi:lipooligosaccharide transport system permease protein